MGETHKVYAEPDRRPHDIQDDWRFVRRVLIVLLLVALAYFVWLTSRVLLLLFASILFAILLNALADLIARRTPIPRRWSLSVGIVSLSLLLLAFFLTFGWQLASQIEQVVENLPAAINAGGARLGFANATEQIAKAVASGSDPSFLFRATSIGYTVVGAVADLVLVVIAAVYLAADPTLYREGVTKLMPPNQHARIFDAMDVTGSALQLWFAGQLVSMVVLGAVSGLVFWQLGLPAPVALGVIAGITNFIPFIGPILGAIPALVFALAIDGATLLWTAGAVLLIQQVEGNVIMPLVQRRAVSMPPALTLFAIVIFGLLFGLLGVFLAAPLAVTTFVLVKKLWVRQTLGEETVVPGEEEARASRAAGGEG